jgi:hypothetical protein
MITVLPHVSSLRPSASTGSTSSKIPAGLRTDPALLRKQVTFSTGSSALAASLLGLTSTGISDRTTVINATSGSGLEFGPAPWTEFEFSVGQLLFAGGALNMEFFRTHRAIIEFGRVLNYFRRKFFPGFLALCVQTSFFSFSFHKEIPLFFYLLRPTDVYFNIKNISKPLNESKQHSFLDPVILSFGKIFTSTLPYSRS